MKFRLILFTLFICMIGFASIQEEVPDSEKSLIVTSDDASIDAIIDEVANLYTESMAFESVPFVSDCIFEPDIYFGHETVIYGLSDMQKSTVKNFNSYSSHRNLRDGLSFFS